MAQIVAARSGAREEKFGKECIWWSEAPDELWRISAREKLVRGDELCE
jgi:hypothetical protein